VIGPVASLSSFVAGRLGCRVIDVRTDIEGSARENLRTAIISGDWPADSAAQMRLLDRLKTWMVEAPASIIGAPDRDNSTSLSTLRSRLDSAGLTVDFAGYADDTETGERVAVVILAGEESSRPTAAPTDFRVVAIMPVFNEADIIVPSLENLIQQGIEVYLLDNWSNDETERLASRFLGRGLIRIEKFPADGPGDHYELRPTLERIASLADEIRADWIVANDADEVRCSPWPGVSLRDAIYAADQRGFNAIDYTNIIFEPTDDRYQQGSSLGHFRYFRFGPDPWHLLRINSWKRLGRTIDLVESGGHEVRFEGRRVFPFKFLLKHYPIRSQRQGERKIFRERKPRFSEEERAIGWHVQYDQIGEEESFIRDPATLLEFDETLFPEEFLIERLSGIGTVPALMPRSRTIGDENSSATTMNGTSLNDEESTEAAAREATRFAGALGAAEAELTEARLRLRECLERERRLIDQVFGAEERLAETLSTEHELRMQIARYAEFHEAVKKSRSWKLLQAVRRLFGREW
jgi:Glycosyl transferase family 2